MAFFVLERPEHIPGSAITKNDRAIATAFWLKPEYIIEFPQAGQALLSWHEEATQAQWNNPNELKVQFMNASILGEKRVVFNSC